MFKKFTAILTSLAMSAALFASFTPVVAITVGESGTYTKPTVAIEPVRRTAYTDSSIASIKAVPESDYFAAGVDTVKVSADEIAAGDVTIHAGTYLYNSPGNMSTSMAITASDPSIQLNSPVVFEGDDLHIFGNAFSFTFEDPVWGETVNYAQSTHGQMSPGMQVDYPDSLDGETLYLDDGDLTNPTVYRGEAIKMLLVNMITDTDRDLVATDPSKGTNSYLAAQGITGLANQKNSFFGTFDVVLPQGLAPGTYTVDFWDNQRLIQQNDGTKLTDTFDWKSMTIEVEAGGGGATTTTANTTTTTNGIPTTTTTKEPPSGDDLRFELGDVVVPAGTGDATVNVPLKIYNDPGVESVSLLIKVPAGVTAMQGAASSEVSYVQQPLNQIVSADKIADGTFAAGTENTAFIGFGLSSTGGYADGTTVLNLRLRINLDTVGTGVLPVDFYSNVTAVGINEVSSTRQRPGTVDEVDKIPYEAEFVNGSITVGNDVVTTTTNKPVTTTTTTPPPSAGGDDLRFELDTVTIPEGTGDATVNVPLRIYNDPGVESVSLLIKVPAGVVAMQGAASTEVSYVQQPLNQIVSADKITDGTFAAGTENTAFIGFGLSSTGGYADGTAVLNVRLRIDLDEVGKGTLPLEFYSNVTAIGINEVSSTRQRPGTVDEVDKIPYEASFVNGAIIVGEDIVTTTTSTTTIATTTTTKNTTTTTVTTPAPGETLYGDVNLDGKVGRTNDCVLLIKAVAGKATLDEQQTKNANVEQKTSPNTIVLADVETLVNYLVGEKFTLPVA
ncbi:MAG: hypothetical protein LBM93_04065 [Oscillospiraceae bacterium]|jgi:hypothetical protein|nr:hypothetical protein [Oscillospiraceae bacterium]